MIPRDDKHEMLFTPSPYARARPIILIRDSIRVFDDWKQIGWGDPKSLIKYYTTMFPLLSRAPANTASSLLYEKLTQAPREGVQHICQHWGVPFSEQIFASTEIDTPYHGLPSNMEKTENWGAGRPSIHALLARVHHPATGRVCGAIPGRLRPRRHPARIPPRLRKRR